MHSVQFNLIRSILLNRDLKQSGLFENCFKQKAGKTALSIPKIDDAILASNKLPKSIVDSDKRWEKTQRNLITLTNNLATMYASAVADEAHGYDTVTFDLPDHQDLMLQMTKLAFTCVNAMTANRAHTVAKALIHNKDLTALVKY